MQLQSVKLYVLVKLWMEANWMFKAVDYYFHSFRTCLCAMFILSISVRQFSVSVGLNIFWEVETWRLHFSVENRSKSEINPMIVELDGNEPSRLNP